jgi:hypothetical protein
MVDWEALVLGVVETLFGPFVFVLALILILVVTVFLAILLTPKYMVRLLVVLGVVVVERVNHHFVLFAAIVVLKGV